jgi:uncharacterized protein involved in exopolysaccharide biosynthesis
VSAPDPVGAVLTPAALWRILRRRGALIAAAGLGLGLATLAATFLMTPLYSVQTTALPADEQRTSGGPLSSLTSQLGGLASLAGIQLSAGGGDRMEALEVLRSRDLMRGFISDRGLLEVLFQDDWDAEHARWRTRSGEPRTINEAVERFRKDVCRISDDKRTNLVTVAVTWRDRAVATEWANEYLRRANEALRRRALTRAEHALNYLEHELASTQVVETRQAMSRLIEVQLNTRMMANLGEEYAFKVVDRAVAPDRKDVVSPRRVVLALIGALVGGALGVFGAALLDRRAMLSS